MPDLPVIDPQAIENLRALDPENGDEFLREIIGIFLDDTPQRIAELDQSFAAGDAAKFARAAHSIKGSAANLGALVLRATAETLEHQARQTGLAGTETLVATVKTDFALAQTELAKLLPTK
jgi:HPt (histidine-containing phosphotransfer) domain-containing protein